MNTSLETIKQQHDCMVLMEQAGFSVRKVNSLEAYCTDGCPICGGTRGESDRFRLWRDHFWCRQCNTGGDTISLMQMLQKRTFAEVMADLGQTRTASTTVAQPVPSAWKQDEAESHVARSHAFLMDVGGAGARYLAGRSITPETWVKYNLGYSTDCNDHPGIVIPWYRAGKLVAVKYRWLEPHNGTKLVSMKGSAYKGNLYGGQAIKMLDRDTSSRRLLLVEGEINALSIGQVAGSWLDVLSLGSEGQRLSEAHTTFLTGYASKLVWMDKPSFAKQTAASIGAAWYASEKAGVAKQDANDHLRAGTLQKLLVALYITSGHDRQHLAWDLSEAPLDADTLDLCKRQGLWD